MDMRYHHHSIRLSFIDDAIDVLIIVLNVSWSSMSSILNWLKLHFLNQWDHDDNFNDKNWSFNNDVTENSNIRQCPNSIKNHLFIHKSSDMIHLTYFSFFIRIRLLTMISHSLEEMIHHRCKNNPYIDSLIYWWSRQIWYQMSWIWGV